MVSNTWCSSTRSVTYCSADTVARLGGLKHLVGDNLEQIDARKVNSLHLFDDADGIPVIVRVGRYGPYLERTKPVPAGFPPRAPSRRCSVRTCRSR